jgi:signal transduction histidine kinase
MTSSSNASNPEQQPFSVFAHPSLEDDSLPQGPEFASRFLPRLVHETRSPSHAISYFLEAFNESVESTQLTAEAQENLAMIQNSADELRVLLRSLSRLAHSQDEKRISPVRVRPAIEKAWAKVEATYGVKAELSADCAELVLLADDRAIDTCFQCVLDNSFKFRHPERSLKVAVTCEKVGDDVHLRFRDNGIGIEAKYLHKCYQYFERLHSRSVYPGGGLGVPTAAECIRHLGGSLTLESDGQSHTQVTLTFPTASTK